MTKHLENQRFGRLVAIRRGPGKPHRKIAYWLCACDCGNTPTIRVDHLTLGKVISCGCALTEVLVERNTTHGLSHAAEYKIWQGMLKRCYNPKNNRYHVYGGIGITVCERWRTSFENFYKDMGDRPSSVHSIDRRESSGNYEPSNCHWATDIEQSNNRRNNVCFTIAGEKKTLMQWCNGLDINYKAAHRLIRYKGMQFEDAFDYLLKKKIT